MKTFLSDTWEMIGQGDGFSYPSGNPSGRIDYMWITKDSIEPLKIEVLQSDASDHDPVFGEFRLK
jgi:endonuclease/exonuclease/phosphatase (EEP) superfamily protein YafD